MYLPFDVEHPGRESFPSPLQGREDILKEANPDRLQDGIHGISTWAINWKIEENVTITNAKTQEREASRMFPAH